MPTPPDDRSRPDDPPRQAADTRGGPPENGLIVGRISGVFGVRGWARVFSHTSPRTRILDYSPWLLRQGDTWTSREPVEGRAHGKGVVVRLAGCDDRDAAAALINTDIAIRREQLPVLDSGEYYWADLQGCQVRTTMGVELGQVDSLFETGANDVMVVKGDRERLIPFLTGQAIVSVDLEARLIIVDWDPDF